LTLVLDADPIVAVGIRVEDDAAAVKSGWADGSDVQAFPRTIWVGARDDSPPARIKRIDALAEAEHEDEAISPFSFSSLVRRYDERIASRVAPPLPTLWPAGSEVATHGHGSHEPR
jgi:hypothetical protein